MFQPRFSRKVLKSPHNVIQHAIEEVLGGELVAAGFEAVNNMPDEEVT